MDKKYHTILFVILFIAIVIRILYFNHLSKQADYSHLILDPQFNDYWAHKILYKGYYPSPTGDDPMIENTPYGRPPGYPFLLALIYFIFGDSYTSPRLLQFFLGIVNVLLLYELIITLFNRKKAGLIGAFFISVLWELVYFEGEINYPVWVITITILLLRTSLQYITTKSNKHIFLAGILLGVLALFRPNALLLIFLYIITLFLIHGRANFNRFIQHSLLFFISTIIVIFPVLIRNYIVSKEFFLISCFGGINAYIGNNNQSTGDSPTIPNIIDLCGVDNWDCFNYRLLVQGLGIKQEGRPYSFTEASRFFYRKAYEFWKTEPISAIKLTLRKMFLFWSPAIVSDGKVIYYDRLNSILRFLPGFPLLAGLFLLSIIVLIQRRYKFPQEYTSRLLFLIAWCLIYSFSVIPFFVSERYRIPLIPPLCVIGGVSLSLCYDALQKEPLRKKFFFALYALSCFVLIYLIPVQYRPDLSRWYYHKAIVSYRNHDEADAMNYAYKALSSNPQYSEVHAFLGIIFLNKKEVTEAEKHFLKALDSNPTFAMANNNLGYVKELQGQLEPAKNYYQRACDLSPVYTLAWINLGRIFLYYEDNLEKAKDCFERAVQLEPHLWTGWFHLGNTYIHMRNFSLAETALIKSLSFNSDNALILNNLGFLYIQEKHYEKAIEYLKKALEKEPQLTDAMFNLGNAFKGMNKLDEAEYWYKKVLEIDPLFTEAKVKLDEINSLKNK